MSDDALARLVLAVERLAAAQERIADAVEGEQVTTGSNPPRRRRRAVNNNASAEPAKVPISEIDRRRAVALAKRLGFIVPGDDRKGA